MKFKDVIQLFTKEIGLEDTTVDSDGSLGLRFDDRYELFFTPNPEDRSLLMYAELMDAADLTFEQSRLLLEKSLLGAQTSGCCFSIDSKLNKVVLWKRYTDNFEDSTDFGNCVNTVLGEVIHWQKQLRVEDPDAEQVQKETAPKDQYSDNHFADFI